jgi:hypothetical protein
MVVFKGLSQGQIYIISLFLHPFFQPSCTNCHPQIGSKFKPKLTSEHVGCGKLQNKNKIIYIFLAAPCGLAEFPVGLYLKSFMDANSHPLGAKPTKGK